MSATWEGVESSGLPDDFDFTINKAEFGYDAQYNNGEQILFMIESRETDDEGKPFHQYYSLGRAGNWETLDHGRTVVSQSDPPKDGFNRQSAYQKFIDHALEAGWKPGAGDAPDNAAVWEGLTFHMNRVDVDYGGEIGKKQFLMPTAFVSGKAEAPAAAPAADTTPAETGSAPATSGSNVLEVKLIHLAKQTDTHDGFIEAVMEQFPEAQNDEDLFGRVLDENGFYASARS